jgi:hypothetical protein
MVGAALAIAAEDLFTFRAVNSIDTHMNCSFFCDSLSCFIFIAVVDMALF